MGPGLLLIPALGGYWFLTRFNNTRDGMGRVAGYHIVIRSAVAGLFLFVTAHLIVLALHWTCPQVAALWAQIVDPPVLYSDTSVLSFLLGMAGPQVLNRLPRFDRNKALLKLAREEGNFIELVVNDAIDDQRYLQLSLQSGKV